MEEASNVNEEINNVDVEDLDVDGDNDEEVGPKSKKRGRKEAFRSEYWAHFDKFFCEIDKVQKDRCKYCDREIKANPKVYGTRPLKNHFLSCKKNLMKLQLIKLGFLFNHQELVKRKDILVLGNLIKKKLERH